MAVEEELRIRPQDIDRLIEWLRRTVNAPVVSAEAVEP